MKIAKVLVIKLMELVQLVKPAGMGVIAVQFVRIGHMGRAVEVAVTKTVWVYAIKWTARAQLVNQAGGECTATLNVQTGVLELVAFSFVVSTVWAVVIKWMALVESAKEAGWETGVIQSARMESMEKCVGQTAVQTV